MGLALVKTGAFLFLIIFFGGLYGLSAPSPATR